MKGNLCNGLAAGVALSDFSALTGGALPQGVIADTQVQATKEELERHLHTIKAIARMTQAVNQAKH